MNTNKAFDNTNLILKTAPAFKAKHKQTDFHLKHVINEENDISSESSYMKKPKVVASSSHIESSSCVFSETSRPTGSGIHLVYLNFDNNNRLTNLHTNNISSIFKNQFKIKEKKKEYSPYSKKIVYDLNTNKLEANLKDPKRSESVMACVMPPIISFNPKDSLNDEKLKNGFVKFEQILSSKNKIATPMNLMPLKVSYQSISKFNKNKKHNISMSYGMLNNL